MLDPALYEESRLAALASLQRHPELAHDDEIWIAFTEAIVRGMGGDARGRPRVRGRAGAGVGGTRALHALRGRAAGARELRAAGLKIGLVSNGSRDLDEFVAHHGLDVDCAVGSRAFGRTKPHPRSSAHALALLDVEPEDAAMVGDSYEDDIEGARALGMTAFLLDRDDRHAGGRAAADLFALRPRSV